ncbi:integrator complex subunit 12-like isoform X2 [Scleropages formosus]|uniref:Integrator complex subunit 12 n=1 Tax=Scleropages formosus TaxID=113540 RepID=A0A8C9V665_SCLFO|nr:integrator complex subunit 12-like isoform X2 [Scleropages formosus]
MATTVSLELDPIFLKGLGYLHSKSKDSAQKLKALLDEALARGSDSIYRVSEKEQEVLKLPVSKVKDVRSTNSPTPGLNGKSSSLEKSRKEVEKRPPEKIKADISAAAEPPKKARLEKQENRSSPVTVQTSRDLAPPDLSSFDETSADDFAMEMGLACVVCRQMTVTSGNQLVECQECHNLYHQDCHRPQVTDKDVNDPRLVWYCARCTRQMKRMAQKTQKSPHKPGPAAAPAATVGRDSPVRKPENRPKPDTASTFLAFKRTEVKSSTVVSATSSGSSAVTPTSGLTGWAAFGAKTAATGPAGSKLGSSGPSSAAKTGTPSSGHKVASLPGLVRATGASSGTSSGPIPAVPRPPPPLTLGKPASLLPPSGDSGSKAGALTPSSSQASSNGNTVLGGNANTGGGSSGVKGAPEALAGGKTPTSQESQLNAMKRLQMVKKKAAQKKLKK